MKESVGYTLSLNIMFIFITIIITFLCSALIYFKSNKASNIIMDSIERYEGYNAKAESDIIMKLSSLGYNETAIRCANTVESYTTASVDCPLLDNGSRFASGEKGYCVYYCDEGNYYYYRIKTNMMINIPIINNVLNIPIITNTERLYNFE